MFWRVRQYTRNLKAEAKALRAAVREHGRGAREVCGKSLPAQVAEMIALRMGRGRLAPDEYYQYCLFDDRRFTREQKREFMGRHMDPYLWRLFNCWPWDAVAKDKLLTYSLFEAFGLPSPRLHAVFHPVRYHGAIPVLRDTQELGRFLRDSATFPFVAKPVMGIWGKGVYAVESRNEADELVLTNGDRMPVDEFVTALAPYAHRGYVFQELLVPHPEIAELCGPRICSVRMVTLLDPEPTMISTLWKVATGRSMADNYWEEGNLVGPVDTASGRVGQLFTGLGLQRRNVSEHPDTGRNLVGVMLPDWQRAVDVCLRATAAIPGIKMQAWDIALTDRGPVLLEVNVIGGLRLPQMVVDAGLNRGPLKALIERCESA